MKTFLEQFSSYDKCLPAGLILPEVKIDDKHYERLKISKTSTNFDFLRSLCHDGMNAMKFSDDAEKAKYDERLQKELALFYELGFTDYLLIVWDILNFCHESQIPTGLGRGCLHPDSLIRTNQGIKKISEINSGDKVINKFGDFDDVLAVHKWEYSGKMIGFRTAADDSNIAYFTPDHKILVLRNRINPKDPRRKRSYKVVYKDIKYKDLEWVRADEVKKDDYVIRFPFPIEKGSENIDLAKFSDKYDSDFCYEVVKRKILDKLSWRAITRSIGMQYTALQYVHSNGFENAPHRRTKNISKLKNYLLENNLTEHDFLNYSPDIERHYPRYINGKDFGFLLGFYAGDGSISTKKSAVILSLNSSDTENYKTICVILDKYGFNYSCTIQKKCHCLQFTINSRILVKALSFYCFGKCKDSTKGFAPEIYSFKDEAASSLVDGLIKSDGTVNEYGYIRFNNTSASLSNAFRELYFGTNHYPVSTNKNIGKNCKNRNAKDSYRSSACVCGNRFLIRTNWKNTPVLCSVKEITTRKYSGFVHDLTIKNDPSFSTSNFIVHNSAAGSLVLYLIGVTGIDPVKHNLYFERFVSKARSRQFIEGGVKYLDGGYLADCDSDISYERRQEVIDYIYKKYPNNASSILTFATLSGKLCVKECSKIVEESSEEDAQHTADSIPKVFGKVMSLKKATKESEKFGKWAEKHKKVFSISKQLEGLIKNTSVHPSGVAICNKKIDDICPISYDDKGRPVAGYEMGTIAELMVKVDILGLRTLSVVDDCCKRIGIDWKTIDINHHSIYNALQNLEAPKGIFQIEADATFNVCKKIKPSNIQELSDVIAISRPGAMSFVDEYVDIKNGNKVIPERHPILDAILKETKGIIIYQESIMRIAHEVFGFSLEDADILRKIVGKKKKQEVKKWQSKIESQAKKVGVDKSIVDFYWKSLNDSADYLFCLSHSVCYAFLGAICCFLKVNYPQQFFISLLKMSQFEPKPQEEIRSIAAELNKFNVNLLPPDLASSNMDFKIEGKDIRYGLSSIKGISEKTLEALSKFRSSEKPNKLEIFSAAKEVGLNIGALSALIQAGTLTGYRQKRSRMVLEAQCFNLLTDREKRNIMILAKDFEYDLLGCIKSCYDNKTVADDQRVLFKDSRFETLKTNLQKYKKIYEQNSKYENFANWYFEKQLLGYSPNLKLKNIMGEDYNDSSDIPDMGKWSKNKLIGTVESSKKAKSGNGNAYILLQVHDDSGAYKAILCDNQRFKKCTDYLESGKPIPDKDDIVVLVGSPSEDGTIFIEDMSIMNEKIFMGLRDLSD